MPPKPFNPPRPTTSTPSTSKPKGRPKGATNKSNGTSTSITKRKSTTSTKGKENAKRMSGERSRLSAASVRSLLPSLSPDTGDEVDGSPSQASDDPFSSPHHASASTSKPRPRPRAPNPDLDLAEDEGEEDRVAGRKERIPDDLLGVILHEMFKENGTRMSRDANRAVGKYVDTFVREGLARAAWAGDEGYEGGRGVLEVEDLERLAPQLLLDF